MAIVYLPQAKQDQTLSKLAQAVTFVTDVRDMPASNLSPVIDYYDTDLSLLSPVSSTKLWDSS